MEEIAYISGSISKNPKGSKKEFLETQLFLEEMGYSVYNPRRHSIPFCKKIKKEEFNHLMMKLALKELLKSDFLVVLDDWQNSKGAKEEVRLAEEVLDMPIYCISKHGKLIPKLC